MISILQNVKYFDKSYPAAVRMKGATSKDSIVLEAEGKLRVEADVPEGFVDVHVFYSPLFTSTLLLDRDISFATPCSSNHKGQVMSKYFDVNNKKLCEELEKKEGNRFA